METAGEKTRKASYRDSAENGSRQFNLENSRQTHLDVKMQVTQNLYHSF